MVTTPSDWLPGSPFRRADWRWRRATWLTLHGKRPSSRIDDEWVLRARTFLTARSRCTNDAAQDRLARREPAISEALRLAKEEPSPRRWEIQARLLAGEAAEAVAGRFALSVAAVETYVALHFDVPHQARDWIAARVIGPGLFDGFKPGEQGRLWMALGFLGGVPALEVGMAVLQDRPLPDWAVGGDQGRRYQEARLRLSAKLAIGSMLTEPPAEWQKLIAVHSKKRRLELRLPDNAGGDRTLGLMARLLDVARGPRRRGATQVRRSPRTPQSAAPNTITEFLADAFQLR